MTPELFKMREKLDFVVCKWTGKDYHSTTPSDYIAFAKYIGYPNWNKKEKAPTRGRFIVDIDNPKIQQIIELACGPHTLTILKMVHIRAKMNDQSKRTKNNTQTNQTDNC